MTSLSFDYQLYPPGETEKYRPMIRVELAHNESTAGFQALIDSGSDWTISFVEIGQTLGIDFTSQELKSDVEKAGIKFNDKIEGLTGLCEVYTTPVILVFGDNEEQIIVRWLKKKLDPGRDFPVILGQDSVFSLYDVHFSRRQKKFFLNTEILSK